MNLPNSLNILFYLKRWTHKLNMFNNFRLFNLFLKKERKKKFIPSIALFIIGYLFIYSLFVEIIYTSIK